MCDFFLTEDVQFLLHNKFVVIIGSSVQRGIYKDLVLMLQKNQYLTESELKRKGECSHQGDVLLEGGCLADMTNKKSYQEVRQYHTDFHLVRFYFVTRSYSDYVETILEDLCEEPRPDVILMNSCLWDITRYGPSSIPEYKKNLEKLFTRFNEVLQVETLVVWNTALPVASNVRSGFMVPEVRFLNDTLRLDIMEANFYARQVAVEHGYDVLDLHFYFRAQTHRRVKDGVHWDHTAHRRISNFILTHISEAWGVPLPRRNKTIDQLHQDEMGMRSPLDVMEAAHQQCNLDRYGGPIRRPSYPHQRSVSVDPSMMAMSYNNPPQQQIQRLAQFMGAVSHYSAAMNAQVNQQGQGGYQQHQRRAPQNRYMPYNRNLDLSNPKRQSAVQGRQVFWNGPGPGRY